MQSNPETEWPRQPDTGCVGCQDACRRGGRCPGPLEELESFEVEGKGVCEDCREWVAVGKEGGEKAEEKGGEKKGSE
jgi:hypothetical protein